MDLIGLNKCIKIIFSLFNYLFCLSFIFSYKIKIIYTHKILIMKSKRESQYKKFYFFKNVLNI